MDTVLERLESKIEELVKAYKRSSENEAKLSAQIAELEARVATDSELSSRCSTLEAQRDDLGKRLESVLSLIDDALSKHG